MTSTHSPESLLMGWESSVGFLQCLWFLSMIAVVKLICASKEQTDVILEEGG